MKADWTVEWLAQNGLGDLTNLTKAPNLQFGEKDINKFY